MISFLLFSFLLLMIMPISHNEYYIGCKINFSDDPYEIFQDNPVVQYFLSKHPNVTTDGTAGGFSKEGSSGIAIFESTSDSAYVFFSVYTDECYVPLVYYFKFSLPFEDPGYDYKQNALDIWTDAELNVGATRELFSENQIMEILKDKFLSPTHQKWLNHKTQTVYVFPESVDVLTERGYLVKQIDFFDFEKVRP